MLIATFGPTTGWLGKTITFENDAFVLQDHGPISTSDVMRYDQQGHLVWASDGTRAWVGSKAQALGRQPARSSATSILKQRRMGSARRVLTWNAWCFAVLGVLALLAPGTTHDVSSRYMACIALFFVAPAAVILFRRPAKATAVRRWLKATTPGDFGWAVYFGWAAGEGFSNWSAVDRSFVLAYAFFALALAVFGVLSVRGVLVLRRVIKMGVEPESQATGQSSCETGGSAGEALAVQEVGSVATPGSEGPAGITGPRREVVTSGADSHSSHRRSRLVLVAVAVVVAFIAAVALIPMVHNGSDSAQIWAGYCLGGQRFTSVTATWTQPKVPATWMAARQVDIWVGLDGVFRDSPTVEQTGTGCEEGFYPEPDSAWYEMFPKANVTIDTARVAGGSQDMAVSPGDTITATVTSLGDRRFRLTLVDDTKGERFSIIKTSRVAKCDSAEIIVEAHLKHGWGLADFGTVHFTDCLVDGRPIGSFKGYRTNITAKDGHLMTSASAVGADGTSFTVTRR